MSIPLGDRLYTVYRESVSDRSALQRGAPSNLFQQRTLEFLEILRPTYLIANFTSDRKRERATRENEQDRDSIFDKSLYSRRGNSGLQNRVKITFDQSQRNVDILKFE